MPGKWVYNPGKLQRFYASALAYDGVDCLLWPTTDRYGQMQIDGRKQRPHRMLCEHFHGPKPTPKHEVAHRCGKSICVNWRHLRWATPQENTDDKYRHGTVLFGDRNPSRRKLIDQAGETGNGH